MMTRPGRVIAAGGRKNHDSLRFCFWRIIMFPGNGYWITYYKALQAFVEMGYSLRLTHD
jgi:hypothetical protein